MRRFKLFMFIILFLGYPVSSSSDLAFPTKSEKFDFTLTTGQVVNLSEYQDKPILLEWTASWCGLCEENLRVFRSIYDDFKEYAHFITLGYERSGDDLDIIRSIENSKTHGWDFGFDHTNYADVAGTANADVWIMDKELNIVHSWDEVIVTKSDLSAKLSDVIGEITSVITTDNIVITSTVSFNNNDKEFNTFGLLSNPLFLGFISISSILVVVIIIMKKKR